MTDLPLPAPGDRLLDVQVHGPEDAPLVLVQHGTPGGHDLPRSYRAAADALGLRLASWSRPGYGRSTRRPGRVVADVADDALAVADGLGAARFATTGGSGGGPHALAIGALCGDRCVAVATVASVAPWDAEGLDPLAGMGEGNVEEFGAALRGEQALAPLLAGWRDEVVRRRRRGAARRCCARCSARPTWPCSPARWRRRRTTTSRAALAPGVDGWLDDDLAFVRPWGFAAGGRPRAGRRCGRATRTSWSRPRTGAGSPSGVPRRARAPAARRRAPHAARHPRSGGPGARSRSALRV